MKRKGSIAALRWAGAIELLHEAAASLNIEYRTIEQERGWLRETVFFEVSGPPEEITRFFAIVEESVDHYNAPAN